MPADGEVEVGLETFLAAESVGETSLIAGDIIDAIPDAIRELEDEDEGST